MSMDDLLRRTQEYNEEGYPIMKGNANMARGASYFEVPMVSWVYDRLWQGCSPSEFPDGPELLVDENGAIKFDLIVNLFPWGEYEAPQGTTKVDVEAYDGDEVFSELDVIASMVVEALDEGQRVFVHCQAGLNRSSLVVARTLMIREGVGARDAIAMVRRMRSDMCLCNENFRLHLLDIECRQEEEIDGSSQDQ